MQTITARSGARIASPCHQKKIAAAPVRPSRRAIVLRADGPEGSGASTATQDAAPAAPTTTASPEQQQQQQQPAAAPAAAPAPKAPVLAEGQGTAIVTGAISIIFGLAYFALVYVMDMRGGEMVPAPPEAYLP
jgi:hypothetical protein